ncbi:hypothetical chaperone protein [Faunimonas pinastri]|uniref:Hypothetical chaperone protein n=1 Tax=Faunimonas pinastri TaxID=1855383 RepID=A0A1H9FUX0_9HYPH|nr:Hsp70 family protein [Faunimonas pinastri]SEQ41674.1 hypothetical chaperone protein [Faunimonas pinastri]
MSACGLDFGTSNTTLGTVRREGPELAALEADKVTIPSAIFYRRDGEAEIGRAAISAYVEGVEGRLMRALKSVLGSALLDEATPIGRRRIKFREVIADYLREVKRRAEAAAGTELTQVVHGRPVHFVDGDPEGDRRAEDALRDIAGEIGFTDISFQFEPIAAALDYERQINSEQIALIADIGGGTSDFSIVRLSPERHAKTERGEDILANDGVRIGGTDFDRFLSLGTVMPLLGFRSPMQRPGLDVPSGYFHDLATWSSINRLYDPKTMRDIRQVRREARQPELLDRLIAVIEEERGHTLAIDVEGAKIGLSDAPQSDVSLGWIEPGLAAEIGREDLVRHTDDLATRIAQRIGRCLDQAGLAHGRIDALFLTGGSTQLAHVRSAIVAAAPEARVVEGDTFGSVGIGLTVEAARRYA